MHFLYILICDCFKMLGTTLWLEGFPFCRYRIQKEILFSVQFSRTQIDFQMFSITHACNLFLSVMFSHISSGKIAFNVRWAQQRWACLHPWSTKKINVYHVCHYEHWPSTGNLQRDVAIILAEHTWKVVGTPLGRTCGWPFDHFVRRNDKREEHDDLSKARDACRSN